MNTGPDSNNADLSKHNLLGNFKRMISDEIFADFDVETSDKKVLKAHKNVLAFGSPYFYGMLTNRKKEARSNVVKVPEDSVIMREVLRFIYSYEVENLDAISCELVFAAQKYQLADLKALCIENIINTLSTKNVLQALLASDRLSKSDKLKDKCIAMVSR